MIKRIDIAAIVLLIVSLSFYEAVPASQPQQKWESDTTYNLRKQRETTDRQRKERQERKERQQRQQNNQSFNGWCTGRC